MSGNMLIGTVLVAVALIDAFVGFTIIVPRVQEARQGLVRLVVGSGSVAMFALGAAFLMGWIGETA